MTSLQKDDLPSSIPPSSHRLPTVSASAALRELESAAAVTYSTGLPNLDTVFTGTGIKIPPGLPRGGVTEIFGPPGVGKTTFGLQLAAHVLTQKKHVIWIASQIAQDRFEDILEAALVANQPPSSSRNVAQAELQETTKRLDHVSCKSLAHLLVLLLQPPLAFMDCTFAASLIILDNISTAFQTSLPGFQHPAADQSARDAIRDALSRKWNIVAEVAMAAAKLAATRKIPVVILNKVTTRVRTETGAVLRAAIESTAWETNIANRIVLYRDWLPGSVRRDSVRFAGVIKSRGLTLSDNGGLGKLFPFTISKSGLNPVSMFEDSPILGTPESLALPVLSRKRKADVALGETDALSASGDDVGDSEDYGWDDETEIPIDGLQAEVDESLTNTNFGLVTTNATP